MCIRDRVGIVTGSSPVVTSALPSGVASGVVPGVALGASFVSSFVLSGESESEEQALNPIKRQVMRVNRNTGCMRRFPGEH